MADAAEVIYVGGDIVTMDGRQPTAEALAVECGRISAIGDRDQILSLRNSRTRIGDLAGATLLPGFIDPHSSVGKLADLVVSADNPLNVDQMKIKDIQVVETIKEGVTIYTGAA